MMEWKTIGKTEFGVDDRGNVAVITEAVDLSGPFFTLHVLHRKCALFVRVGGYCSRDSAKNGLAKELAHAVDMA